MKKLKIGDTIWTLHAVLTPNGPAGPLVMVTIQTQEQLEEIERRWAAMTVVTA